MSSSKSEVAGLYKLTGATATILPGYWECYLIWCQTHAIYSFIHIAWIILNIVSIFRFFLSLYKLS